MAVVLGTVSAIGLRRVGGRTRQALTGLFLAPMIVPVIVTAVAVYRSALDVGLSRSEEHTSELQSLMRNSYAVFCLKKKTSIQKHKMTKIREQENTKY